jgi:hypothetical protein
VRKTHGVEEGSLIGKKVWQARWAPLDLKGWEVTKVMGNGRTSLKVILGTLHTTSEVTEK